MINKLADNWESLLTFIGISAAFGMIKVITSQSKMPMRYKITSLVISVLVGTLAGQVALEAGVAEFASLAVASVFSLLARDLVHAILDRKFTGALAQRAAENLVDKVTK